MSIDIEALFTKALGLGAPWRVEQVELDTEKRRIDFHLVCDEKRLDCPECHAVEQGIHDRIDREWRHLDFFQFEAYLHAKVPRVHCLECGKSLLIEVPQSKLGSVLTIQHSCCVGAFSGQTGFGFFGLSGSGDCSQSRAPAAEHV